jgi:DNA-binding transcriptional MerR regulator
MDQFYSTGQVAKLLGIQVYQIGYAHSTGQLAEPAYRFLQKRVYTETDIRRVAEHFGIDHGTTSEKEAS